MKRKFKRFFLAFVLMATPFFAVNAIAKDKAFDDVKKSERKKKEELKNAVEQSTPVRDVIGVEFEFGDKKGADKVIYFAALLKKVLSKNELLTDKIAEKLTGNGFNCFEQTPKLSDYVTFIFPEDKQQESNEKLEKILKEGILNNVEITEKEFYKEKEKALNLLVKEAENKKKSLQEMLNSIGMANEYEKFLNLEGNLRENIDKFFDKQDKKKLESGIKKYKINNIEKEIDCIDKRISNCKSDKEENKYKEKLKGKIKQIKEEEGLSKELKSWFISILDISLNSVKTTEKFKNDIKNTKYKNFKKDLKFDKKLKYYFSDITG